MNEEESKNCRKCVYFLGEKSNNPRFVWSHCRAGVQNLNEDSAYKCGHYADTIEKAISFKVREFIKRMGWNYCPHCGQELLGKKYVFEL